MRMPSLITCAAMALTTLVCGVGLTQNSGGEPVKQACAADVARFCANAKDITSRVQCMNQHDGELSEPCKAARSARAGADGQVPIPSGRSASGGAAPVANLSGDEEANFASVESRMVNRSFPSIFAPWNVAENLRDSNGRTVSLAASESPLAIRARYDFFFSDFPAMGLRVALCNPLCGFFDAAMAEIREVPSIHRCGFSLQYGLVPGLRRRAYPISFPTEARRPSSARQQARAVRIRPRVACSCPAR
jgi:hypothetical protein